ncbi:hypothetical protein [Vasconcelosia minhoensis]|uniref:hypothetical protein n=1 Tax=Vasconcelosia minhoensis TaxID=3366354 RepID=UPI001D14B800|nr:hypothetical protein [Romeria gracilis]
MSNLTGIWLGTYWQADSPTRFEATFAQASNSLSGRILDQGPLGEASVQGEVIGRRVTFTKQYLGNQFNAIRYTGTLSEDGNHIDGQWVLDSRHSGPWEAHRNDQDLASEFSSYVQKSAAESTQDPAKVPATVSRFGDGSGRSTTDV